MLNMQFDHIESCDSYRYQSPSNQRSIRLVVLDPNAKFSSVQGLTCNLGEASVDSPRPYLALSYTWGREAASERLLIHNGLANGEATELIANTASSAAKHIFITPNCAMALRLLQKSLVTRFKTCHNVYVWVDAICINQSDSVGRSRQLAMMAEIYHRAKGVVVWLDKSYAPVNWTSLVGSKPLSLLPRVEYDHNRGQRLKSCVAKLALKVCDRTLHRLRQAPYWTRVWTLQEFAHKNPVILCLDSRFLAFSSLAHLLAATPKNETMPTQLGLDLHLNLYQWQATTDRPFRGATNHFRRFLAMKASEPRDKIFALRALSPGVLGKMRVDYQQPIGDVFREATKLMIEEKRSLRVLYFSNREKTTAGVAWDMLPSWAVDFATEDADMRGSHKYYYSSLCAASGRSKPFFAFSTDGMRVCLRGVSVGNVVGPVSDIFPARSECMKGGGGCVASDKAKAKGKTMKEYGQMFPHVCHSPYLDVLGKFMKDVACAVEPGDILDAMGSSLYQLLWWIIQGPRNEDSSCLSSTLPSGPVCGRGLSIVSALVEWDSEHFGNQCGVELRVGRLFFTSDQTAGFAVTGVREGGVVCLIAGLDHPFILRPRTDDDESYTLVGPTVFAGVMGGEMWPDVEDELEDFEVV